jgi:hypothetical protein
MAKCPIPAWLPADAWNGYCEMRKQKKKPMTAGALTRTLNSLERMMQEGEDLVLVLNQSEDQGYVGVFPVSASYRAQRGLTGKVLTRQFIDKHTDKSWAD